MTFYFNQSKYWKGRKRGPQSLEHRQKLRLAKLGKRGEETNHWKGGLSDIKHRMRSSDDWKKWREAVFERDNYTCQECYLRGVVLEPHHIIPLKETLSRAFEINNGITLCRPCHMNTMGKEKLFEDKYLQIANRCYSYSI